MSRAPWRPHRPPHRLQALDDAWCRARAKPRRAVVAHLGGFTDDHAESMVDEHTMTNTGSRMNFDAGQHAGDVRNESRGCGQPHAPQRVGQPMKQDGVNTRVTEQDLERRSGGRIALAHDGNVFPDSLEHRSVFRSVQGSILAGRPSELRPRSISLKIPRRRSTSSALRRARRNRRRIRGISFLGCKGSR